MALVPIKGKPGLFFDSTSQKVINIVEWREDDKWDTVARASSATAVAAGTQLQFFRDLTSKQRLDTNIGTPRKIPAGEEMRIERIGVHIPLAFGNVVPDPTNIKKFTENAYLLFQINRKDVAEGPLVKFPSGYGLSGQTVETDAGVLGIGTPATAAAAKLAREQFINNDSELDATITFYNRDWATVAPVSALTATTNDMPILSAAIAARCFLHGLIRAAATKG